MRAEHARRIRVWCRRSLHHRRRTSRRRPLSTPAVPCSPLQSPAVWTLSRVVSRILNSICLRHNFDIASYAYFNAARCTPCFNRMDYVLLVASWRTTRAPAHTWPFHNANIGAHPDPLYSFVNKLIERVTVGKHDANTYLRATSIFHTFQSPVV